MSAPSQQTNLRESTISSILGTASAAAQTASSTITSYGSSATSYISTSENGSYILNVLFYVFMYIFLIFIVMLIIHFAVRPVFKFTPGSKGLIGIPASSDDKVYWNNKKQPLSDQAGRVPAISDNLSAYPFDTNFSFSIDLFVRRITDSESSASRVILYKTYEYGNDLTQKIQSNGSLGSPQGSTSDVYALQSFSTETLEEYMKTRCSMYMYLSDTNNLGLTFFSGTNGTPYSIKEIKNIPLYTPFRITVVVERRTITMYMNGKQTFQRIVPTPLSLNSLGSMPTSTQRFYAPPLWAKAPTQTFFLQNLHIWPREITYDEVVRAQPALALASDFELSAETGTDKCS